MIPEPTVSNIIEYEIKATDSEEERHEVPVENAYPEEPPQITPVKELEEHASDDQRKDIQVPEDADFLQ